MYTAIILLSFLATGIQPALATIYIPGNDSYYEQNGSTYTLKVNVNGTINIASNGITLDGGGFKIVPFNEEFTHGIFVSDKTGITIQNVEIEKNASGDGFDTGIHIQQSSTITLTGNNIQDCDRTSLSAGIDLNLTYECDLTNNIVSNNSYGIRIANNYSNIDVGNTLTTNNISNNDDWGIWLDPSNNNTVKENDISINTHGIYLLNSSNNEIYNNNFIDNFIVGDDTTYQARVSGGSGNVFNLDPFGGNYWSDYSGSGSYIFTGGQDDAPYSKPDGWVKDTTPHEISCPGDLTIEAMGPDGVPIDDDRIQTFLAGVSATDNCDPPEAIIITNNAPSLFPPGDTVVTFTATDTSDNSST
jgi:parallel beta-helix repeat protein